MKSHTKIVGFDLGTNSIGTFVRNKDLKDQTEYFSVDIFESGVGNGSSGEYSYAAERTKCRSARRLRIVRFRRRIATLKLLIQHQLCPLTMEELERWNTYDKHRGVHREYPLSNTAFQQWIKCDFNGDGISDLNPYALRRELATIQLDFSQEENRFKLGRALYHIAQRRGFKSSKGETLKEQEKETLEKDTIIETELNLKASETKVSSMLSSFMEEHNYVTVGQAIAHLIEKGIRFRGSEYHAVRAQYRDEISYIFKFQEGLSTDSELYRGIMSTKKGEGTMFYKNPLRSQKGSVGYCTLEPRKKRCPISHPAFEEFRAWSFLNNIKYRRTNTDEWNTLPLEIKKQLYTELFCGRVKRTFPFKDIRERLEKILSFTLGNNYQSKTINYHDSQSIAGCPVIARLVKLLGNDWKSTKIEGHKVRTHKNGEHYKATYGAEDLWHICYTADEEEDITRFCVDTMKWDNAETKKMIALWGAISEGYAMLSLKALNNINHFLKEGFLYNDAVFLARLPEILKDEYGVDALKNTENIVKIYLEEIKPAYQRERLVKKLTNTLIDYHKGLDFEETFAYKDTEYQLMQSDKDKVQEVIHNELCGNAMPYETLQSLTKDVEELYQNYFSSSKREFYQTQTLQDFFKQYLIEHWSGGDVDFINKIDRMYHHSQISVHSVNLSKGDTLQLPSPNTGSIKNPVVMRTLHILRKKVNALLQAGIIDEDTRVVVETSRDFNDSNRRSAIRTYQKIKENTRAEIEKVLREFYELDKDQSVSSRDIDKMKCYIEQRLISNNTTDLPQKYTDKYSEFSADKFLKLELWREQGFTCIYTGEIISLADLLNSDKVDIEHTIPRSLCYDDSQANLTLCKAQFNRNIKGNQMPYQLANYDEILQRIEPWQKRIEQLIKNVNYWKGKKNTASTKEGKDKCIQQIHIYNMELEYWKDKVDRFTRKDVPNGFKNRQLVDTGIITTYATRYLKTIFKQVDVQKGAVTAAFRKILGLQSIEEKKDRNKHSHHAIDAAILTMIPTSASKRESILQNFYRSTERGNTDEKEGAKRRLDSEVKSCRLPKNVLEIPTRIEEQLLVQHWHSDKTFCFAKKKLRRAGKVVKLHNGTILYSNGSSFRRDMHQQSYYGAIKLPRIWKKNEQTYDEGQPIVYVIRQKIADFTKFNDLEKIIDPQVKESIRTTVQKRISSGISEKKAFEQGNFWILDKMGNEIKIDKNGRPLSPIRHVRCRVVAGRGYLSKAIAIRSTHNRSNKQLINITNRDHKRRVYAQNSTNYLCLLYSGLNAKGKAVYSYRLISNFEMVQLKNTYPEIKRPKDILKIDTLQNMTEDNVSLNLKATIKVGTRLLEWKETPSELQNLSKTELLKRLFVVEKFNEMNGNTLYLRHHLDADSKSETTNKTKNQFKHLIEGFDFTIDTLGNIIFK